MSESSFDEDEIQQEFRRSASKGKNVDYDKIQAKRDLIAFAKRATPEEFATKIAEYGAESGSAKAAELMRLFWQLRQRS